MKISVRDKDNDLLKPLEIITLKGEDGITPNIQIGTVNTVPPDQEASVVKRGTKEEPIFDFNIPRGGNGNSNESGESSSICIDDTIISKDKTWSSGKIEEFVHTNDGAVWSSLHGEGLSVDYTKEGHLREIEVWGNTVQNEDNLSDIQHLGVWSEEKQGYKIDIVTTNQMFNYDQKPVDISLESDSLIIVPIRNGWNIRSKKKGIYQSAIVHLKNLTPNTTYRLKAKAKNYNNTQIDIYMNSGINWEFKNETTGDIDIDRTFIPNKTEVGLHLYITKNNGEGNVDFTDFILVKDKNDVENLDIHKTTLLLPCQLMKVGGIADRLYWDSDKGRYVIEKYIYESVLPKNKRWLKDGGATNGIQRYYSNNAGIEGIKLKTHNTKGILSNKFKASTKNNLITEVNLINGAETSAYAIYISLNDAILNGKTPVEYIDEKNATLYYALETPQLIDTDIREEIKLPTFINNTYITVDGGIQGSIKAKAPVDRSKVISVLQEENIKLKETNNIQDELINTTMLATDEILTILEPLIVDLLSNNSSSKIVDMYVAMVKRGLKDKDLNEVPLRYREQVKEMISESMNI